MKIRPMKKKAKDISRKKENPHHQSNKQQEMDVKWTSPFFTNAKRVYEAGLNPNPIQIKGLGSMS